MKKVLFTCLLVLCLLCVGSAQAGTVVFNPELHAFPTQLENGDWSPNGPRPFIEGEMGEGLLEIWFGRVSVCDCFIVRCNGEVMMIDGGMVKTSPYSKLLLEKLGIDGVDYLFNTHHHDDHLQMQEYLLRTGFNAGVFLTPYGRSYPVEAQQKMEATVDTRGIPYQTISHGDTLMLGGENGAQITFYRWTKNTNANFSSVMCRIVYGERSVYLMADVIGEAQKDLAENYLDVIPWDSDILKVGHHGYTKQDPTLLSAISPELCIVTNSKPGAAETIAQLNRLGLAWKNTETGTVYARTDGTDTWEYIQDKSHVQK